MALLVFRDGAWVFTGGKHREQELVKVAQTDPSYLTFLHSSLNMFSTLSDAAQDALQAAMYENGVPFEAEKKPKP